MSLYTLIGLKKKRINEFANPWRFYSYPHILANREPVNYQIVQIPMCLNILSSTLMSKLLCLVVTKQLHANSIKLHNTIYTCSQALWCHSYLPLVVMQRWKWVYSLLESKISEAAPNDISNYNSELPFTPKFYRKFVCHFNHI
jgi:hypothetical protein